MRKMPSIKAAQHIDGKEAGARKGGGGGAEELERAQWRGRGWRLEGGEEGGEGEGGRRHDGW